MAKTVTYALHDFYRALSIAANDLACITEIEAEYFKDGKKLPPSLKEERTRMETELIELNAILTAIFSPETPVSASAKSDTTVKAVKSKTAAKAPATTVKKAAKPSIAPAPATKSAAAKPAVKKAVKK